MTAALVRSRLAASLAAEGRGSVLSQVKVCWRSRDTWFASSSVGAALRATSRL